MVGVVEADAHELAHLPDASADAGLACDQWQTDGIDGCQGGKAGRRQYIARNVFDMTGQVTNLIVSVQQAGFFRAFFSVT